MQENQPNTPADVDAGTGNQSENPVKPGQPADNKTQHDGDEKLTGSEKNTTGDKSSSEVDQTVQGKKLENKDRGGDTQDAVT